MRILSIVALCGIAGTAAADYTPLNVQWKNWTIESSENVIEARNNVSYPLTYLFDHNAQTAWVYRGNSPREWVPEWRTFVRDHWHGDYAIGIRPDKPTQIDAIRIMNGYNKSAELFAQNDRVKTVEIWNEGDEQGQLIKRVNLSDKMGWHSISIPSGTYKDLKIVFTQRHAGQIHDLCISGLELWSKNKPINMKLPPIVSSTDGDECGCFSEFRIMTIDGHPLPRNDLAEDKFGATSPKGRYIAGVSKGKRGKPSTVWVYDLRSGKSVLSRKAPKDIKLFRWISEKQLEIKGKSRLTLRIP